MIKHKDWVRNIFRKKDREISRYGKLCLDKNERISSFEKKFFNKLISKISSDKFTYYPEVWTLYKALSKFHKLNKKQFVVTAGSDAAIKSCFELFVKKGDKVIVLNPTFAMVDIYCKIFRAKKINISYDENLSLNINYLIKSITQKISLIIIANPNSPTGTLISKKNMEKIIKKANLFKVPLLVDEAYFGFSNQTVLPLLKKYQNLILSRTFSKAYGLAGLRVGYIIANKAVAKLLFNLKPMYEVNSIGVLAATMILKNVKTYKQYINQTKQGLKFFTDYLKKNNISFIKTHANFIYINFGKKINYYYSKLYKKGIFTKPGVGIKGYENYLRITLGPKKEIKTVIKNLNKF